MPALHEFEYAVIRVVPHVERDEFLNVGVILYCRALKYLAAIIQFDAARLRALAPDLDLAATRAELETIPRICAGGKNAGALGELTLDERFKWLTSPRSATIQISPAHSGLCDDPKTELDVLRKKTWENKACRNKKNRGEKIFSPRFFIPEIYFLLP